MKFFKLVQIINLMNDNKIKNKPVLSKFTFENYYCIIIIKII